MPASFGPVETANKARAGGATLNVNAPFGAWAWVVVLAIIALAAWLFWAFVLKGA